MEYVQLKKHRLGEMQLYLWLDNHGGEGINGSTPGTVKSGNKVKITTAGVRPALARLQWYILAIND